MRHRPRLYFSPPAGHKVALGLFFTPSREQRQHLEKVFRGRHEEIEVLTGDPTGYFLARRESTGFRLESFVPSKTEPAAPLVLAFGVPRHALLAMIFEKGTELGVTHFLPLRCCYSQGDHFRQYEGALDRLGRVVEAAACQSRRNRLPAILGSVNWSDLPGRLERDFPGAAACVLHPGGPITPTALNLPLAVGRVLVVGPEGGFAEEEIRLFHEANFRELNLGERILRLETAVIAGLALISFGTPDGAGR